VQVELVSTVSFRPGNGKHLSSPNSPGEAWVAEILRHNQAIRSGKVNAMHTHLIIVLGQLVSLLG